MSAEVLVIGGGVVGAACALWASRAGLRVRVIERGVVGGGATAAGMGHLVAMDDSPAQLALTARGLELWRGLAPQLSPAAQHRTCGTLWIVSDGQELDGARVKRELYAEFGLEAELLDAEQLRALEPHLRPGLAGGLRVPADAVVYAPVAALELLKLSGAQVIRGEVRALEPYGVRLMDGTRLTAEVVVLAGGTASLDLLPELPIRPRRGQLVITERDALPAPGVRHQLVELGYLHSAHGTDADSIAFNVQPRPGGQLLIGSSRQYLAPGADPAELDWPLLRRMLTRAAEYLPTLRGASALRAWTGLRAATPDSLPLIGPHPTRPGLYLATGHEGLGITTATATAELLVGQLMGTKGPLDPALYTPNRLREPVHA